MKRESPVSALPLGPPGTGAPPRGVRGDGSATRRHIRGSGLLLMGRIVALLTNFAVQVLAVRYLAKNEYGAFSYAISVIAMGTMVALLGFNKGLNRFVPLYHERDDYRSMFGVIFVGFGAVAGLGAAIILLTFGLQGVLLHTVVTDPLCVGLLLIMISLVPLQAVDDLCLGLLASFQNPRWILFRRYILGPSLKLGAVMLVIALQGNVYMLAVGYLTGGVIGTLTYVPLVYRTLKIQGLLDRLEIRKVRLPVRELFKFSVPLITVDLFYIFLTNVTVLLLESFWGTDEVADLRAVVPVAGLNLIVHQSLKQLYAPMAARLYARNDGAGLNDIYWQSALWVTLLTFPLFASCLLLADPITVLLFGSGYEKAGTYLAILACGNFFNAAMGLNVDTLQVYGRVRFITTINVLAVVLTLVLQLLLIPRWGALGAALTTVSSIVVYNLLNHAGLFWKTGVKIFQWKYLKVYLLVAGVTSLLLLLNWTLKPPPWAMAVAIAAATLLLLRSSRQSLDLAHTFPELKRIPYLGAILTGRT